MKQYVSYKPNEQLCLLIKGYGQVKKINKVKWHKNVMKYKYRNRILRKNLLSKDVFIYYACASTLQEKFQRAINCWKTLERQLETTVRSPALVDL